MTDSAEARLTAAQLVGLVRERGPELLAIAGADIGPALEQQLFMALRDDRSPPAAMAQRVAAMATGAGRLGAAAAAAVVGLMPVRAPRGPGRPLVVLVREPVHLGILEAIGAELMGLAGERLAVVRVGRAASPRATTHATAPRLARLLDIRLVGSLAGYQARVASRLPAATAAWDGAVGGAAAARLRRVAAEELPRIGLGAVGLASIVRRWRPALLAAFDEVGTWARILPAVGRASGILTLDLPHAEAARPIEISGAGYDRLAVYGPRAAAVMRAAGIEPARIVEIGAPGFDALAARATATTAGERAPRRGAAQEGPNGVRVVFAGQYVTGAMTAELLESSLRGAIAAAAALAPSELVIVPHPAEPRGMIAKLAARQQVPPGVTLRTAAEPLHDALPGAALMVTGWSNSVFEAALLGVPSLMVDPGGRSPVPYVADGLAIGVATEAEASEVARSLRDASARDRVLERAAAALAEHLGPLDGRASERAARLMLEMAGRAGATEAAA